MRVENATPIKLVHFLKLRQKRAYASLCNTGLFFAILSNECSTLENYKHSPIIFTIKICTPKANTVCELLTHLYTDTHQR